MKKPRIAVLIDWYLPGTRAGGPVRSVYSLVQLMKNDYTFCVITSGFDLGADKPYADVPRGEIFEREGVHYYYAPERAIRSQELQRALGKFGAEVIYLNSFWSYSFSVKLLLLCRAGRIKTPVILAPRGMLGSGAMQLKSLKKRIFLRIAGLFGLHRSVVFHATQAGEAADIRARFPNADIRLAPNVTVAVPRPNTTAKKENHVRLFFLSRISRVKNLHFALETLRRIEPGLRVEYDLYGNIEDAGYWEQCLQVIASLPGHVTVCHRGELAFHEVQAVIGGYHALLMPTLNENYGHSIVEALMCGCLAIISDQTPWTDVNRCGGYAMPLADPLEFTKAVQECARMNEPEFRKRSSAAIEYISNKTNIAHAARQYRDLFGASIGH